MAKKKKQLRWPWLWLLQALVMLLAGILTALSLWLGGFTHGLFQWALMPLAGFISACRVTHAGLLNHAAWIAPPIMELAAHMLVWGYLPAVGPIFLCGFISLIGAATGEVLKRRDRK